MVYAVLPCELEEVEEEKYELRELVDRYDNLMEDCMRKRLSDEDQRELDQLYAFLLLKDEEYWDGVSYFITEQITESLGIDFPMLRYCIDMLPELTEGE